MKKKTYNFYGRIKAIIIDDDIKTLNFLNRLCENYFPEDFQILGCYDNPTLALQAIPDMSLDLIFLDIEMPEMDGFDFIKALSDEHKAKIVIISSHTSYAVKAFKFEAFDYLPKPIAIQDLRNIISRFYKINQVANVFNEDYSKSDMLIINRQDKAVFVELKEIVRLEANGSYTDIFLDNGSKLSSTKNIMYYETKLKRPFYKVHRSHLVNLNKIKELQKNDGDGIIIMQDNSKINISRSKKNEFLKELTS